MFANLEKKSRQEHKQEVPAGYQRLDVAAQERNHAALLGAGLLLLVPGPTETVETTQEQPRAYWNLILVLGDFGDRNFLHLSAGFIQRFFVDSVL